jgi:hypothetical protein
MEYPVKKNPIQFLPALKRLMEMIRICRRIETLSS